MVTMSEQYRLMIYFAVATLHLNRASIAVVRGPQTPKDFAERNKKVIERICDEALSLFGYELSHEQIGRAIRAYLAPGQSAVDVKVAILP